uniref:Uncharacterized protein n=1 Tax=Anthurium amnicola TaxID=1678845 RepID=A0A1D1YWR8_9ARAE
MAGKNHMKITPTPTTCSPQVPREEHNGRQRDLEGAEDRGRRGRGGGEHARPVVVPRERGRRWQPRGHPSPPPRQAHPAGLPLHGRHGVSVLGGGDGGHGLLQRAGGGLGHGQGEAGLRGPPEREGGDEGGDGGSEGRHLPGGGKDGGGHAGHGEPWLRTHQEGVHGECEPSLRAEREVSGADREEGVVLGVSIHGSPCLSVTCAVEACRKLCFILRPCNCTVA